MEEYRIEVVLYKGEKVFKAGGIFFRRLDALLLSNVVGVSLDPSVFLWRDHKKIAEARIGEFGTHGSAPAFLGSLAELLTGDKHWWEYIIDPVDFIEGDVLIVKTEKPWDIAKDLKEYERGKGDAHRGEIVIEP